MFSWFYAFKLIIIFQDTALYLVRAENINGFDEEWVELVVLGKPARPQGPLEVSNITANGCRLNWKAPLDDGGMPIQEYEVEKFDPKLKRWVKVREFKWITFKFKN